MKEITAKAFSKNAVLTPIVMKDGEVLRRYEPLHQLQLDQGLDSWATTYDWMQLDNYCFYGTGSQTLYRSGGTVTASQSGTTVTFSASFAISAEVGGMIKWDSGEEARITSLTSTTEIEVDTSQTVASGTFGIHYTHATGLAAQSDFHGAQDTFDTKEWNGTDTVHTTKYHHFDAVTTTTVVTELGYGPSSSLKYGLQNLASPVTLDPGEELVVQIDRYLVVPVGTSTVNLTTGGSTVATMTAQLGSVYHGNSGMWPFLHEIRHVGVITSSTALPGVTYQGDTVTSSGVLAEVETSGSYTSGSFSNTVTVTFPTSVTGTYYGVALYADDHYSDGTGTEIVVIFSSALSKTTTNVLKLNFTFGIGRELVNE